MNISAHEVSELLFHPANFDNDDGIETNGGLPDIKQVSFDFISNKILILGKVG